MLPSRLEAWIKYAWIDILYTVLLLVVQYCLVSQAFFSAVGTAEDGYLMYAAEKFLEGGQGSQLLVQNMGPLYQLWYVLFIKLFGALDSYYISSIVISLITAGTMYVLFRRKYSAPFSFILASLAVFCSGLYQEDWLIYRLALAICLLGAAVYVYSSTVSGYILGLLIVLLSTFARNEYLIPFCLLAAFTVYVVVRKSFSGQSRFVLSRAQLIKIVLVLVLLAGNVLLIYETTLPGNLSSRVWNSFSYFYTIYIGETEVPDLYPSTQNQDFVIERDFGEVNGITEAVRANPVAVAKHIGHNLEILAKSISQYYTPILLAAQRSYIWNKNTAGVILVAILELCYLLLTGIYLARREVLSKNTNTLGWIFLFMAFAILHVFILRPKTSYLIPLMPFSIFVLAELLERFGAIAAGRLSMLRLVFIIPGLLLFGVGAIAVLFIEKSTYSGAFTVLVFTGIFILLLAVFLPRLRAKMGESSCTEGVIRRSRKSTVIAQYSTAAIICFVMVSLALLPQNISDAGRLFDNAEGRDIIHYLEQKAYQKYNIISLYPAGYAAALYPRETHAFELSEYVNNKPPIQLLKSQLKEPGVVIIKDREWRFLPDEVKKLLEDAIEEQGMTVAEFRVSAFYGPVEVYTRNAGK